MNTAQDCQTSFFTTLHFKMNSSQTTDRVKINTGAQPCTIPLCHFKKMFSHKINSHSTLTKDTLLPTEKAWIGHSGYPQKFLGQIILDVHHKTIGRSYPTRFYIFKDTNSPLILISYAARTRLGILQFK